MVQGGGGGACARSLNNAHAPLTRRVIASSKTHVFVKLAACRELDVERERLTIDHRAAGGDGAAFQLEAVAPAGGGVAAHQRQRAVARIGVPVVAVGVVQPPVAQHKMARNPFLGHKLGGQAVQGQVEPLQRSHERAPRLLLQQRVSLRNEKPERGPHRLQFCCLGVILGRRGRALCSFDVRRCETSLSEQRPQRGGGCGAALPGDDGVQSLGGCGVKRSIR